MTSTILRDALPYITFPLCAVLLLVGLRILYEDWAYKREERRKQRERAVKREAERKGRIYLERP